MANILIDQTKELQGDEELEITLRMWKLYSNLMIRHDKIVGIQYMIMYSEQKKELMSTYSQKLPASPYHTKYKKIIKLQINKTRWLICKDTNSSQNFYAEESQIIDLNALPSRK